MDDQRFKAFLVSSIVSAQATIDAIRADLKDPNYRTNMSYYDECMVSDEIAFQQVSIERSMARLASFEPTPTPA